MYILSDINMSMSESEYDSDPEERFKTDEYYKYISAPAKLDFTSQDFLWEMYTRYVNLYIRTCEYKQTTPTDMLTPGLFCEYLSIRTLQKIKNEPDVSLTLATIEDVIISLVQPNAIFSTHPAGPCGYMEIFDDEDGDCPDILGWQKY